MIGDMQRSHLLYFLFLFNNAFSNPIPTKCVIKKQVDDPAVKLLQEYIQIDTSVERNIECAVEFWRRQAAALGLPFFVYRPASKPICVITWEGINPQRPSIILNSHMDVVPVFQQNWTYPPFSGYIDENGDLYGRGAQDTKSVSIHYLEAIRKLIKENKRLQRNIHLLFMPDEETGGFNGMIPFLETKEFQSLNPGFFFDEGLSSADGTIYATYQDKRPWQLNITIYGEGGHGSSIPDGTAVEKFQRLMDVTTRYRSQQQQIMLSSGTNYGAYTTINTNIIQAGILPNIIPSQVNVVIDIRLAVEAKVEEMESLIQSWIAPLGNRTELKFIRKLDVSEATCLDDTNPYWVAVVDALNEMDTKVEPIICPATSDVAYVRNKGYPAIGFAYRPYTVSRIHSEDEYINTGIFLKDEETGGFNGMIPFLETKEFQSLNPGFFFDEGLSSADGTIYATYQDKRPWQLNITIYGEGGHGSSIPDGTAVEKFQRLMDVTTRYRSQQQQIMLSSGTNYGAYTTINTNIIQAGILPNIIPSQVNVVIDIRLAVEAKVEEMESLIQSWIAPLGNRTELKFIRKLDVSEATCLDDTNPYWVAVVDALNEMDTKVEPIICPATSDVAYVRNKGYPAIGFAYRPYTVSRIHSEDEYINTGIFLKGIDVYANILKKVGNLP